MDPSIIVASDPHVLQNLQRCPRLTPALQAALNTLLTSGRTTLGWVGDPIPSAQAFLLEMRQEEAWSLGPGSLYATSLLTFIF